MSIFCMLEPQNEHERQAVIQYEHWLMTNAQYLGMQVKEHETQALKFRKAKKGKLPSCEDYWGEVRVNVYPYVPTQTLLNDSRLTAQCVLSF